tara:strand:+ start:444 stop:599 length:156 start_codon:yes stop_codon:yes gene_type:complete
MKQPKISLQQDKHWFLIGVFSSVTAVILWDLIKYRLKILNYEEKQVKLKNK